MAARRLDDPDGTVHLTPPYDSQDLKYLQDLLEDIIQELCQKQDALACPEHLDQIRSLIACALFRCAETGERDHERLRACAVAAVADSGLRPN